MPYLAPLRRIMETTRPGNPVPPVPGLHTMIAQRIANARERHRLLLAGCERGWLTLLILVTSIVLLCILIFWGSVNPDLFIIASFILFMGYFITLLVPLEVARQRISRPEIARLFSRVRDAGAVRCTERFSRILLDAFFMNCRPLFIGFALFFSVDILIVLAKLAGGAFPLPIAGIILFQSVAIITFYFLVWKLEPYSIEFLADVDGVRQRLIRRRFPEPVVSVLLWSGAALALISVFLVIIMLPGFTVGYILSLSELEQFRGLFLSIAILLVCQYFIFRYIHGITSQDLLARFSGTTAPHPSGQIEKPLRMQSPDYAVKLPGSPPCDEFPEETGLLIESKMYQIERKTLFGAFPVYIVNLDLSLILGDQVQDTLTGRPGEVKKN
jgi:hypothetical protein